MALATGSVARADEPDPRAAATLEANRNAARDNAARGLEHFEAKRWAEAYAAFAEADRLFHVPTLTLAMAQCQEALGRLLAARALHRRVTEEPLPTKAPEQFRTAQATAQSALAGLAKRIPTLVITLRGVGAERARVKLDGAEIGAATLAAGHELDPGEHVVTAESDDGGSARLALTVSEGGTTRADLALRLAAPAPPAKGRSGSLLPAGVSFGAAAVGLAAGAVTGLTALSIGGDIRGRCRTLGGELHCLAADVSARDDASTLATASAIAFAVGGACALTGVVLAIVRPGGSAPAVAVGLGAGSVHLRGAF